MNDKYLQYKMNFVLPIQIILATIFMMSSNVSAQITADGDKDAETQNSNDLFSERPERKPKMLRERSYKLYQKTLDLMNAEPPQYDEALTLLLDVDYERDRRSSAFPNAYESSVFYNTIANIYRSQDNHEKALEYFHLTLEQEAEIPYELEDNINFLIGQLNFLLFDYEEALLYLTKWLDFQLIPPSNNIIFIANVYYSATENENITPQKKIEYYQNAIDLVNQAIDQSIYDGEEPKESWYLLLRVLYDGFDRTDKVLEISELLVSKWPKKLYYLELSGIYARKSSEERMTERQAKDFEVKQLIAMELALHQDMLTEARELESMAQLFLYHEIPYKSSKTMSKALNEKTAEESLANLELLAYGYLEGKDLEKAIAPLSKAAQLGDDGERYMRLANVYLQIDDYPNAAIAIEKALEKGDIDRPDLARIIQGQSYVVLERFDEARAVFREALKDERSEDVALNWLRYINNEEKRIKEIKKYLN